MSATAAFMNRGLKRIVGFCEVVVPSYAIKFRSHFRMTKPPLKFFIKSWELQVQSPQEIILAENQFN